MGLWLVELLWHTRGVREVGGRRSWGVAAVAGVIFLVAVTVRRLGCGYCWSLGATIITTTPVSIIGRLPTLNGAVESLSIAIGIQVGRRSGGGKTMLVERIVFTVLPVAFMVEFIFNVFVLLDGERPVTVWCPCRDGL
jgi:hypothetical protein